MTFSKVSLAGLGTIKKEFQNFKEKWVVDIGRNVCFKRQSVSSTTVNPADLTYFNKNIDFIERSLWLRGIPFLLDQK